MSDVRILRLDVVSGAVFPTGVEVANEIDGTLWAIKENEKRREVPEADVFLVVVDGDIFYDPDGQHKRISGRVV